MGDLGDRGVRRTGRWIRRGAGDAGATLVEMVIAVTLLALLFTALGGVLTNSMVAGLFARQNQNAADLISETIESYRAKGYSALAMDPSDVPGGDPAITGSAGSFKFDPGVGTGPEPVFALGGGAVSPHVKVVTKGKTRFTLSSYITEPADSTGAKYKRVTVRATWFRNKSKHQRQANTFISLVRNGLPLPSFVFGAPVERTFGAGSTVVLPVKITNRGARDGWNMSAVADRSTWNFTWYRDTNNDGVYTPVTDTLLVDSADAGTEQDTGTIETDQTVPLLAVYELPSAEAETATGVPVTVTLKAVSVAQSADPNGTKSVVDKVRVTQGCTGCTYRPYYLHTSADPASEVDMPFNLAEPSPAATSLVDYDNDANPGRSVGPGGAGYAETSSALMANWLYQMPTASELADGAASPVKVRIFVASPAGATLGIYLRKINSALSTTDLGFATTTLGMSSSFNLVEVPVPFGATAFAANERLEVKVESSATVYLAYDTASYPSNVLLPVVSGG